MIKTLTKNRRGIFYGFVVSLGLVFLTQLLIATSVRHFMVGAFILYFIFIFEVSISWFYARKVLAQMEIPQVDIYSKYSQLTHHIILPSILYFSFLGIIYIYHLSLPKYFIFLIAFFTFTLLFVNIRAYYEDKFKLEEKTHYVYDIIKFIVFFLVANSILRLENFLNTPSFFTYLEIALLTLFLNSLILVRNKQINLWTISYIIFASIVLAVVTYILLSFTVFTILSTAIYLLLTNYILSAILHHKLEGTFSKEILLEYLTVLLLSLVILQGLTG